MGRVKAVTERIQGIRGLPVYNVEGYISLIRGFAIGAGIFHRHFNV
jgi:hypothetical protein